MADPHSASLGTRDTLQTGGRALEIFRLDALADRFDVARLPFSLKVLLDNLLRTEDGATVTADDIEALAGWDPGGPAAPLEEGATTLAVTPSAGATFDARVRIDTPNEWRYLRHGGILHYVLRRLRRQEGERR